MLEKAAPFFQSLSEPLWKTTEWIERLSHPIKKRASLGQELVYRVALAAASVLLALPALTLHVVGYLSCAVVIPLRQCPYLFWGKSKDALHSKKLTVATYNVNFFGGGLPPWFGGVEPARRRVDKLAKRILQSQADVVCLQEGFDSYLVRKLFKVLDKKQMKYEACYDIGAHSFKFNSGLVLISKYKVSSAVFKAFKAGKCRAVNRGYFSAVINGVRVILTHLDPFSTELRKQTFAEIHNHALFSQEPTVLLGDFNIDKRSKEYQEIFIANGWQSKDLSDEPTCNDQVLKARRQQRLEPQSTEIIDHIVVHQRHSTTSFATKRLFKLEEDPFTAESDHAPIQATIAFA